MTIRSWANPSTWTGYTPHIEFAQVDIEKAISFALEAQPETKPDGRSKCQQLRDLRVGKLGEIAFRKWVISRGRRPLGDKHMFRVWKGWEQVDKHDFQTVKGKTIDVKTYDLRKIPSRGRLMDFYVEVCVNPNETEAYIMGYATAADIVPRRPGIMRRRQRRESRDVWLTIYRDAVKMEPSSKQKKIIAEMGDFCFINGKLRNIDDFLRNFPPLGEPAGSSSRLMVCWLLLAVITILAVLTPLSQVFHRLLLNF